MAHPKHKTSKAVTRKRRTHKKLTPSALIACPNCSEPMQPHHVCRYCGQYKGREVLEVAEV